MYTSFSGIHRYVLRESRVYRTPDMPANWYKTYDGYYVFKGIDNNWIYGTQSQQGIVATKIVVGSVNPKEVKELAPAVVPTYIPPEVQEVRAETNSTLPEVPQKTIVSVPPITTSQFVYRPEVDTTNSTASNMVIDFSCENLETFPSFIYMDERTSFTLSLNRSGLGIIFQNKTSLPIIIDWNAVSYLNIANAAQRIVLDDVTWATRNNPIGVTHIPPSASINRRIMPADNLGFRTREHFGHRGIYVNDLLRWPIVGGLFTVERLDTNPKSKIYQDFCANYNGRKIGVYIPFQIGEKIVSYTFFIQFNLPTSPKPIDDPISTKSSGLTFDGLTIKSVDPGSLAEKIGLKPGDVIIEVNARLANQEIVKDIDARLAAGRSVIITYERNGTKDMVTLK